jgi:hypothetical protein
MICLMVMKELKSPGVWPRRGEQAVTASSSRLHHHFGRLRMAHLEQKNDPLVKGGWKTVQVRHTESTQCGEKHLATRSIEVVAKRSVPRVAFDEVSVEKAPSQKNSPK